MRPEPEPELLSRRHGPRVVRDPRRRGSDRRSFGRSFARRDPRLVYRLAVAVAAGVDTDLTGEPLRPPVPLNVAVENLPANATDALTRLEMASFVQSIGGDWFPLTLVPSGPNQRAEISPVMPDIAAIDNVVVTQVRVGSGVQTVETRVAGASDIHEDVGPLLLPAIDSAAYDAATNEVRIVAGDGAPADSGFVRLDVSTGSGSSRFYWNVFTPYETGDIVLPELAGALSEYWRDRGRHRRRHPQSEA